MQVSSLSISFKEACLNRPIILPVWIIIGNSAKYLVFPGYFAPLLSAMDNSIAKS